MGMLTQAISSLRPPLMVCRYLTCNTMTVIAGERNGPWPSLGNGPAEMMISFRNQPCVQIPPNLGINEYGMAYAIVLQNIVDMHQSRQKF